MVSVKELAIELSIKLGDPRTDNGDGVLFWSEDRLRYLSRAYGKLIRMLSMGMRRYKPGFVLPLVPMTAKKASGESWTNPYKLDKSFVHLKEVIVTVAGGKKIVASKSDSENYNQIRFGLDEINKADISKEKVFYTTINNQLYLIPDTGYTEINAMGIEDISTFEQDEEIPIDRTYADMLILIAAMEAAGDLPHAQKVGLYRQELIDSVSILTNWTNLMERMEGEVKQSA